MKISWSAKKVLYGPNVNATQRFWRAKERFFVKKLIPEILSSFSWQGKEANQFDDENPPYRFQRTDQWRPVYSWLESLNQEEVVKSKEISDWLSANPEVQEQLCSRHSRYHLMHYIKKCHIKILKRKEKKLDNIDIVLHIGDITYANGYISQWDQFTSQVEPIASAVPYMIGSGNHERDWPNTGSFYDTKDSGGECGVLAETMFYVPSENRAKFWYFTDFGMFHFCIADRQKQPWLIFAAHRVLGYSSDYFYGLEGSFAEPMGRESLQQLWQKYKLDLAFYGHVHNYERTCPIYQNQCVNTEKSHYSGPLNGTIHVVCWMRRKPPIKLQPSDTRVESFTEIMTLDLSILTAFSHSSLLFEYKKSRDGNVYDSFTITRDYKDVLACVHDGCEPTTLAT
ncbi:putative inactive purple acid phosphatase 27 [Morella rubra]|uniref:Putative inactive purple acid phosphatase 27 n=1 Tax=Morella rubra TaxID=262757 RepID=A0A6A1VZH5_9ROSI|nr:putative inactive purple acid phosphatase 27 [Morella rubra]